MKHSFHPLFATIIVVSSVNLGFSQPGEYSCSVSFSIGDSSRNPIQDIDSWGVEWRGNGRKESVIREGSNFRCVQSFSTEGVIQIVNPHGDTMRVNAPYWKGTELDMGLIPFTKGDFDIPYLVLAIHNWADPYFRNKFTPNLSENWNQFRKGAPLPYTNLFLEPIEVFHRGSLINNLVPYTARESYLKELDLGNINSLFNKSYVSTLGTVIPNRSVPNGPKRKGLYMVYLENYYILIENYYDGGFEKIKYGELVLPIRETHNYEVVSGQFRFRAQLILDGRDIVYGSYEGVKNYQNPNHYRSIHGFYKIHFEPLDSLQMEMLMAKFEQMNPEYIQD